MARIRTIKPEFWTDERVVELSFPARLLFIGLWNLCDDHGRMEYSPKRIKHQLFPADKVDVAKICGELRENSMIRIYAVEGHEYLEVLNFRKHQQIKDGDRSSKYPDPPQESSCADLRVLSPQISQEGKGKEGIQDPGMDPGREESGVPEGDASSLTPLSNLYNTVCQNLPKVVCLSKGRREKERIRLKEHPDLFWWRHVFERANRSLFCQGQNNRGWKLTYDFLIANDENCLKVLEGKYDGNSASSDLSQGGNKKYDHLYE